VSDPRVALPGSTLLREGEEHCVGVADPNQQVTATIMLRRRATGSRLAEELLAGTARRVSRENASDLAADPQDLAAVRAFLEANSFKIVSQDAAVRTIQFEGTLQQINHAFGVQMAWFESARGERFLSYQGSILIPESLREIVIALLGLDQRPVARRTTAE
jgi:kumamolisin